MLNLLLRIHCHHEIVKAPIPSGNPEQWSLRSAEARRKLADLHVYPWEPHANWPTGWHTDVTQTWRRHGWIPRSSSGHA